MEIVPKFYATFLNKTIDLRIDPRIDKLKSFHVVDKRLFDLVKLLFVLLHIIPYYFRHVRIDYILNVQVH